VVAALANVIETHAVLLNFNMGKETLSYYVFTVTLTGNLHVERGFMDLKFRTLNLYDQWIREGG
jgi:hypothetical protein